MDPTPISKVPDPIHKLPTEILLIIFQQIEGQSDLISVASASRHFHHIALELLFSRTGIDLKSGSLILQAKDNSVNALPALAMALSARGVSLEYLSCDLTTHFNYPPLVMSETRELTQFISKLSSVKDVYLEIMNPSNGEREEAVLQLLEVVLAKSCRSLAVKNRQSSTFNTDSGDSPELSDKRKPPFPYIRGLLTSLGIKKPKVGASVTSLEALHIQTLPSFLQPFYIQTINSSRLTELSFKFTFNLEELEELCARIYLPALVRLSISHSAASINGLSKLLSRHPAITFTEMHHMMTIPLNHSRLQSNVFQRLEELRTSVEFINQTLPSFKHFPSLKFVHFSVGDRYSGFENAEEALGRLKECSSAITLSLEFTKVSGLHRWLLLDDVLGQYRPERALHCVKVLAVGTRRPEPFTEMELLRFPQWLGLFPTVEEISFTQRCLPESLHSMSENTFGESVKVACPNLKTFSIVENVI